MAAGSVNLSPLHIVAAAPRIDITSHMQQVYRAAIYYLAFLDSNARPSIAWSKASYTERHYELISTTSPVLNPPTLTTQLLAKIQLHARWVRAIASLCDTQESPTFKDVVRKINDLLFGRSSGTPTKPITRVGATLNMLMRDEDMDAQNQAVKAAARGPLLEYASDFAPASENTLFEVLQIMETAHCEARGISPATYDLIGTVDGAYLQTVPTSKRVFPLFPAPNRETLDSLFASSWLESGRTISEYDQKVQFNFTCWPQGYAQQQALLMALILEPRDVAACSISNNLESTELRNLTVHMSTEIASLSLTPTGRIMQSSLECLAHLPQLEELEVADMRQDESPEVIKSLRSLKVVRITGLLPIGAMSLADPFNSETRFDLSNTTFGDFSPRKRQREKK